MNIALVLMAAALENRMHVCLRSGHRLLLLSSHQLPISSSPLVATRLSGVHPHDCTFRLDLFQAMVANGIQVLILLVQMTTADNECIAMLPPAWAVA